ncbi:protein FMP52, mitochondrial [Rhypophila decipiens]|uniref:Protein FMP52, mitochondrial n=1 Tax=Rhypophila decipiens TaxID=261697 RepID=A0AAN7B2J6_9PEZI|nr:protein FMP52, mitochondrial [Rhypophila decipiens]
MKLIVGGSTGFVATEIIRQAISNPAITSIIALGRREASPPVASGPDGDMTKFKTLVIPDVAWEDYPDAVKNELSGANACIWTIAVTPSKSRSTPWETTVKACRDYATYALKTMAELADKSKPPFRFVYVSGVNAVRDPAKKPFLLGDYLLLRGEAENLVLKFAKESKGDVEAAVAKPGIINGPGRVMGLLRGVFLHSIVGLPSIGVDQIAATLIHEVLHGFESDTLLNDDMVRIGQGVLDGRL